MKIFCPSKFFSGTSSFQHFEIVADIAIFPIEKLLLSFYFVFWKDLRMYVRKISVD